MENPDKLNIIFLIKISIIEKAKNLGWNVVLSNNRIILKKKLNNATSMEKNTKQFLEYLFEPI
jgi:hypothetical protein